MPDVLGYWRNAATWLILAVVAVLLFTRLGDRSLWGDEAETALLAQNITKFGLPRTGDGRNLITLYGPTIDNNADGLWIWSPWLDEYLVAASFLAFGVSAAWARFPCALVGLICVALVGHWLWRRHGRRETAWMGMIYLGSMELFLLHARQARYYSLVVLAQILLLYGLDDLWNRRSRGKWIIAAGLLIQFYCNYILVAANLPALVAIALWCRKRMRFSDVMYALALTGIGALPWLIYAHPWSQASEVAKQFEPDQAVAIRSKVTLYLREFHFHVLPLLLLLWPAILRLGHRPDARVHPNGVGVGSAESEATPSADAHPPDQNPGRLVMGLPFFFGAFLLVLVLTPGASLRYLLAVAPVASVWLAEWIASLSWRSSGKWLLLAVLVTSNLPAWLTAYPVRGGHDLHIALVDFIGELTHPYTDRLEELARYLNTHARPDDAVLAPDPAFPLIFHTNLRIIDSRFAPTGPDRPKPDWILAGEVLLPTDPAPARPRTAELPLYERIVIPTPNSTYYGSFPEPDLREYRTAKARNFYVVYRRR